jgi:hypothetical protein
MSDILLIWKLIWDITNCKILASITGVIKTRRNYSLARSHTHTSTHARTYKHTQSLTQTKVCLRRRSDKCILKETVALLIWSGKVIFN